MSPNTLCMLFVDKATAYLECNTSDTVCIINSGISIHVYLCNVVFFLHYCEMFNACVGGFSCCYFFSIRNGE